MEETKKCEYCKVKELKKVNVKRFCSSECYFAWSRSPEGLLFKQNNAAKGAKKKSESLKKFHKANPDKQTGINNPSFGRKREDLSKRNKASVGKIVSAELREKYSKAQKLSWEEGRRTLTSHFISKPEKEIAEYITSKGLEVQQQFRIKGLRWVYDLYIPKLNLIIEFNGSLWHCNPKEYKDPEQKLKFPRGKEVIVQDIWNRDKLKLETIKNLGYSVEVVWDDEFKKEKFNLIDSLIIKYKQ